MSAELKEEQKKLKNLIAKIGMTQKYFIGQYCVENHFTYTEIEIEQYYGKFKKELSRSTTKIEVLHKYFDFLYGLEKFKKIGYVKPFCYKDNIFDDEFNNRMNKISKTITEKLTIQDEN